MEWRRRTLRLSAGEGDDHAVMAISSVLMLEICHSNFLIFLQLGQPSIILLPHQQPRQSNSPPLRPFPCRPRDMAAARVRMTWWRR